SKAHCRTLEARVVVLRTHARRLKWQRQAADDFAVEHIMHTQALEARARDDTLEDAEYVMRDHVPVFLPKIEHPEDLVPAEGTPPWLPISSPFTSRRARIPEADTPPRNRPLLATPRPGYVETRLQDTKRRMMATLELVNWRVSYQVDVCSRESSEFCTRHHDAQKDRAVVRAEIEVLRNERLAYEQEGIRTHEALARSEAHCRALEVRVTVLETQARRLEWQRQAADDFAVEQIMRTQALEAGAHIDTLEDTGSSS
nr:hypothetical protein [Tanacetum cinerariifolium]